MKNSTLLLLSATFIFLCSSTTTLEAQLLRLRVFRGAAAASPVIPVPAVVGPLAGSNSINPKTDWYPYMIARPGDRGWIRQTPMEMRPNRPMHFWGNSRRRALR